MVRVQDLSPSGGARVVTRRVDLETLVAYLFDGRECAQVRELLASGSATAHGARLSWPPVALSAEALSAIERTFPQAEPARPLELAEVGAIVVCTGASSGAPQAIGTLSADHPLARELATRARYQWFDYGVWADVWIATAAELPSAELPSAERRVPSAELSVRFEAPRPGVAPPWSGVL